MKRTAVLIIALICLCAGASAIGCAPQSSAGSGQVSPELSDVLMDAEAPKSGIPELESADGVELDALKDGYTITFKYSSAWEMEEEEADDTRFTHLLLSNDAQKQQLVIVAEISTPEIESLHNTTDKRGFLNSQYIREGLDITTIRDDVLIREREGLSLDFTQTSGSVKMDGIMYAFPWKGYTYAFAYISNEAIGEAEREQIYAMLNTVEFK